MLVETLHGVVAGMSKAAMPKLEGGCGEESLSFWWAEGVEGSRTIASKNHGLGEKMLHSETERVKLNRAKFIDSKLSNRNKIFNNVRYNENITKINVFRIEG
jgi:hypothetical protein